LSKEELTESISLTALIQPARSHPEVIVAAVAARDKKKAQAYAKKYNIPIVHKSYDGTSNEVII
jgi:predicted dehydrogenase